MVKDDQDVIAEFNEYVNMTASELEKWLKSEESSEAGWRKDDGDGKSVGQESGEKIIEILKANPKKDPEKYTEDQIQHMRKVASYCKRHLAQEKGSLEEKEPEEAKKTKSYISLKNWGHDPLKGQNGSKSSNGSKSKSKDQEKEEEDDGQEEQNEEVEEENGDEEGEEDEKKAGDKRKKSGQQNGSNKKRETRQGASSKKNGDDKADQDDEDAEDDGENDEQQEEDGGGSGGKKPSKNGPAKGETVSWKWGSGNPEGKVLDVKEDE